MPRLTECLQTDHRRLDAILVECKAQAAAGRFAAAADRFTTFREGLARHIDAEEDVLFPALAQHTPHARGPVSVMRSEHVQIREWMATLARALAAADPAWSSVMGELEEVLSGHNAKEEHVLYPMADEATHEARELDVLRATLQGMIEARARQGA